MYAAPISVISGGVIFLSALSADPLAPDLQGRAIPNHSAAPLTLPSILLFSVQKHLRIYSKRVQDVANPGPSLRASRHSTETVTLLHS